MKEEYNRLFNCHECNHKFWASPERYQYISSKFKTFFIYKETTFNRLNYYNCTCPHCGGSCITMEIKVVC